MSGAILRENIVGKESGQYLDLDYQIAVPEGTHSLFFDVNVVESAWLNCLIYDGNGDLRGQLLLPGDARTILIHEDADKSSPYTVAGTIHPGEWTVNLSFLSREAVQEGEPWGELLVTANEGVKAEAADQAIWTEVAKTTFSLSAFDQEEVFQTEKGWYKGDFHTHTIYTDGEMLREENIDMARKQDLDFFVATDHNIVPTSWYDKTDILVIPGTEVTSSLGHFNIINLNTSPFVKNRVADMFDEQGTNEIIAQDYGDALVSINHPFLKGCPWIYNETNLQNIDSIEIINDPTYPDNKKAIEEALIAWNILLNDGHRITGIGGSDSHLCPDDAYEGSTEPSLLGDPGTFVHCEKLTAKDLVENVRKGHVTVSRGGFINLTDGTSLPGETSSLTVGELSASVETNDEVIIEWVVDGEIKQTVSGNTDTYSFNFQEKAYHWIRIDVRYANGDIYGFTNPIYFGEKEPNIQVWKEVLAKMK